MMILFGLSIFSLFLQVSVALYPPVALTPLDVSTHSFSLLWRTLDGDAKRFIVTISPLGKDENIQKVKYINESYTTWVNLVPGKTYVISVVAENSVGILSKPSTINITTIPMPPYNVKVSKFVNPVLTEYFVNGNRTMLFPVYGAVVMWGGPDSGHYDGFNIQVDPPDGSVRLPISLQNGAAVPQATKKRRIIWDLVPGVYYNFTVRTTSKNQLSSSASNGERMPPEIPSSIRIDEVTSTSVTLSWNEPHRGILDSYIVEVDPPDGVVLEPKNPMEKSRTIVNLTAGTIYNIDVYSSSFNVLSFQSRSCKIKTPPLIPLGPVIQSNVTNSSMIIEWTAPAGNIDYYEIVFFPKLRDFGRLRHRIYDPIVWLVSLDKLTEYTLIIYSVSNGVYSKPLKSFAWTGPTIYIPVSTTSDTTTTTKSAHNPSLESIHTTTLSSRKFTSESQKEEFMTTKKIDKIATTSFERSTSPLNVETLPPHYSIPNKPYTIEPFPTTSYIKGRVTTVPGKQTSTRPTKTAGWNFRTTTTLPKISEKSTQIIAVEHIVTIFPPAPEEPEEPFTRPNEPLVIDETTQPHNFLTTTSQRIEGNEGKTTTTTTTKIPKVTETKSTTHAIFKNSPKTSTTTRTVSSTTPTTTSKETLSTTTKLFIEPTEAEEKTFPVKLVSTKATDSKKPTYTAEEIVTTTTSAILSTPNKQSTEPSKTKATITTRFIAHPSVTSTTSKEAEKSTTTKLASSTTKETIKATTQATSKTSSIASTTPQQEKGSTEQLPSFTTKRVDKTTSYASTASSESEKLTTKTLSSTTKETLSTTELVETKPSENLSMASTTLKQEVGTSTTTRHFTTNKQKLSTSTKSDETTTSSVPTTTPEERVVKSTTKKATAGTAFVKTTSTYAINILPNTTTSTISSKITEKIPGPIDVTDSEIYMSSSKTTSTLLSSTKEASTPPTFGISKQTSTTKPFNRPTTTKVSLSSTTSEVIASTKEPTATLPAEENQTDIAGTIATVTETNSSNIAENNTTTYYSTSVINNGNIQTTSLPPKSETTSTSSSNSGPRIIPPIEEETPVSSSTPKYTTTLENTRLEETTSIKSANSPTASSERKMTTTPSGRHRPLKSGVTTMCRPDNITVIIEKSVIQIYEEEYGPLHLNDDENSGCRGVEYPTYYRYTIAPNILDCGTTIEINETHVNFSNSISNNNLKAAWMRNQSKETVLLGSRLLQQQPLFINFRIWCTFPLDLNVSTEYPFLPQLTMQILNFNISGIGEFSAVMQLYKTGKYLDPYLFPPKIDIKDTLYVGVSLLDTEDKSTFIVVRKCWGTPERNPNHIQKYMLIENGCPVKRSLDGSIRVYDNGAEKRVRWEGSVFKFLSYDEVWLHCEIKVCFGDNCRTNCDNNRRRRSILDNLLDPDVHLLSTGPIVMTNKKLTTTSETTTEKLSEPKAILAEATIVVIVAALCAVILGSCLVIICAIACFRRQDRREKNQKTLRASPSSNLPLPFESRGFSVSSAESGENFFSSIPQGADVSGFTPLHPIVPVTSHHARSSELETPVRGSYLGGASNSAYAPSEGGSDTCSDTTTGSTHNLANSHNS